MVMGAREVCGEVTTMILVARGPIYIELALANAVSDPVEAHVNGLAALLFYRIVADAGCGAVVRLDWSGGLFVAQFLEGGAEGTSFTAIVEEGREFSLGSAGHDLF